MIQIGFSEPNSTVIELSQSLIQLVRLGSGPVTGLPLGLKFGIAEAVISSDQCFVRCRNRRGFCGLSEIPKTCVQM